MDRLISTEWLSNELGAADLRLLDCTVASEVLPAGGVNYRTGRAGWEHKHIPGSAHIDLIDSLSDRRSPFPLMLPPPEQFCDAMRAVAVGEGTRVVLYDRFMNAWAARVWWTLRAYGFDDAAVLDGGWRAWVTDGRPVSCDLEPTTVPADFVARLRPGLFVGKDEVLAAIGRRDVSLVDALPRDAYRGDRQDYARPGHIPGSRNVPFTGLVDSETHRYLAGSRLAAAFASVLSPEPEQVITYCGAGVAASSDAFALTLLGFDNVAIYDGSRYQWAADPTLPLVVGD